MPKSGNSEAARIHWLRQYASYLTPRLGFFGSDNLLFVVTYFHQLFLNVLLIALAFAVLLLYPRAILLLLKTIYQSPVAFEISSTFGAASALTGLFLIALYLFRSRIPGRKLLPKVRLGRLILFPLAILLVLSVFHGSVKHYHYYPTLSRGFAIAASLSFIINEYWTRYFAKKLARAFSSRLKGQSISESRKYYRKWLMETSEPVREIVSVGLGFAASFPIVLQLYSSAMTMSFNHSTALIDEVGAWWNRSSEPLRIFFYLLSLGLLLLFSFLIRQTTLSKATFGNSVTFALIKMVFSAVLAASLGFYTAYRLRDLLWHVRDNLRASVSAGGETVYFPALFAIGLPICVVAGALTFHLFMGILSRMLVPHVRETLLRMIVMLYRCTFAWGVTASMCFFGPALLEMASELQLLVLALFWAFCPPLFLFLTRGALRSRRSIQLGATGAAFCTYVFLIGMSLGMSFLVSRFLAGWRTGLFDCGWRGYFEIVAESTNGPMLFVMAIAAILLWALSTQIGINLSSMHLFYQARLAWAYLQEGLPGRERFRLLQGITLANLEQLVARTARMKNESQPDDSKYAGPYLILNATLNLSRPRELAWQERLGANFVFTPLFCGYELPPHSKSHKIGSRGGYQPTSRLSYNGAEGVRLSQAMAISGSALGTAMGLHTSPRVRFIHSVFNLRLGWWFANPSFVGSWRGNIPRSRLSMLTDEFLGRSNDSGPYVHLSDGGHFENLGVYELVRRKCKLVLVSDASEDRGHFYHSLGNAVERCRTDLNVEIKMQHEALSFRNAVPYALGEIVYDNERPDRNGVLIYIKAHVNASVPLDVWAFKRSHPIFPHHSTANQWFLESHFESYRALGFHLAQQCALALRRASDATDIHEKAKALLNAHRPQPAIGLATE